MCFLFPGALGYTLVPEQGWYWTVLYAHHPTCVHIQQCPACNHVKNERAYTTYTVSTTASAILDVAAIPTPAPLSSLLLLFNLHVAASHSPSSNTLLVSLFHSSLPRCLIMCLRRFIPLVFGGDNRGNFQTLQQYTFYDAGIYISTVEGFWVIVNGLESRT